MNQPLSNRRGARLSSESDLPFCAVILYHDVAAASKAAALLNRIVKRLGDDVDVETTLWSFDVLRLGPVAELAMERFAEADLIIVSSDTAAALPLHAGRCLETAMDRRRDDQLAVAALICGPQPEGGNAPLCDQLRKLCCRNEGDSFFCTRDVAAPQHDLTPDDVTARARASSSVLDSIMRRPLSRDPYWGA